MTRRGKGGHQHLPKGEAKKQHDQEHRRRNLILGIESLLSRDDVDIHSLRKLAVVEGLVSAQLRRKAWPKLLGVDSSTYKQPDYPKDHHYADQIGRDVVRSLGHYKHLKKRQRREKQAELSEVLNTVVGSHPELHYYQGFHDICTVLLLTSDVQSATCMAERLATHHLREAMSEDMQFTMQILELLYPLVRHKNPAVVSHFEEAGLPPYFGVSWILTWYSHKSGDVEQIARLFDFFLASHPLMPLYYGAQVILHVADRCLELDCDMPTLHAFLQDAPDSIPPEMLLTDTMQLFNELGPRELQKVAGVQLGDKSQMNTFPYTWMSRSRDSDRYQQLKRKAIQEAAKL